MPRAAPAPSRFWTCSTSSAAQPRSRAEGKNKKKKERKKIEERDKERGCMREVLIKKNTMKSWRNCFSDRRAAQARKKAIRIFNVRLGAFPLIFQHRRKPIRQKRASTLLACIPFLFGFPAQRPCREIFFAFWLAGHNSSI